MVISAKIYVTYDPTIAFNLLERCVIYNNLINGLLDKIDGENESFLIGKINNIWNLIFHKCQLV